MDGGIHVHTFQGVTVRFFGGHRTRMRVGSTDWILPRAVQRVFLMRVREKIHGMGLAFPTQMIDVDGVRMDNIDTGVDSTVECIRQYLQDTLPEERQTP